MIQAAVPWRCASRLLLIQHKVAIPGRGRGRMMSAQHEWHTGFTSAAHSVVVGCKTEQPAPCCMHVSVLASGQRSQVISVVFLDELCASALGIWVVNYLICLMPAAQTELVWRL
jgi:hypothetical protein